MFFASLPFHVSLIVVSKAGAYPSTESLSVLLNGRLLALVANIRLV
jgi:hypothetical protein